MHRKRSGQVSIAGSLRDLHTHLRMQGKLAYIGSYRALRAVPQAGKAFLRPEGPSQMFLTAMGHLSRTTHESSFAGQPSAASPRFISSCFESVLIPSLFELELRAALLSQAQALHSSTASFESLRDWPRGQLASQVLHRLLSQLLAQLSVRKLTHRFAQQLASLAVLFIHSVKIASLTFLR